MFDEFNRNYLKRTKDESVSNWSERTDGTYSWNHETCSVCLRKSPARKIDSC